MDYIAAYKDRFGVEPIVEVLNEHGITIALSTYYEHAARRFGPPPRPSSLANIRLRNQLVPGVEGGFTRHLPGGEQTTIFEAATQYASNGVPLMVIAGADYGSGSSRDWAAKGTLLLESKRYWQRRSSGSTVRT